jgi:hypothetical protein
MKHKVSELEGPLLDAAVAKTLWPECGVSVGSFYEQPSGDKTLMEEDCCLVKKGNGWTHVFSPSLSWNHGGPVLPGSGKVLGYGDSEGPERPEPPQWRAKMPNQQTYTLGPTPLIAAMRAYVHAKFAPPWKAFADEVEL